MIPSNTTQYLVLWVQGGPDGPYGGLYEDAAADDCCLQDALYRFAKQGWELVGFHDEFAASWCDGKFVPARQVVVFRRGDVAEQLLEVMKAARVYRDLLRSEPSTLFHKAINAGADLDAALIPFRETF